MVTTSDVLVVDDELVLVLVLVVLEVLVERRRARAGG